MHHAAQYLETRQTELERVSRPSRRHDVPLPARRDPNLPILESGTKWPAALDLVRPGAHWAAVSWPSITILRVFAPQGAPESNRPGYLCSTGESEKRKKSLLSTLGYLEVTFLRPHFSSSRRHMRRTECHRRLRSIKS
jgi:hypothetical protein